MRVSLATAPTAPCTVQEQVAAVMRALWNPETAGDTEREYVKLVKPEEIGSITVCGHSLVVSCDLLGSNISALAVGGLSRCGRRLGRVAVI